MRYWQEVSAAHVRSMFLLHHAAVDEVMGSRNLPAEHLFAFIRRQPNRLAHHGLNRFVPGVALAAVRHS